MDLHIKRKGITLKIDYDYSYNPNPREDDNLGVMACYHTRYSLGDENVPKTYSDFKEWYNNNKEEVYCMLPVYLLDHSGLRMSVNDFKDPWDSGQVGFIYCTKEAIEKAGLKDYDKHSIGKILKAEVDSYDEYLQGNPAYYFCIRDEDDKIVDSVTGFRGDKIETCLSEMKEYVDDKYHFLFDAMLKKCQESYL